MRNSWYVMTYYVYTRLVVTIWDVLRVSCAGILKAEETERNNVEFVRRTPDLVKVISLEQSGGSDYPLEWWLRGYEVSSWTWPPERELKDRSLLYELLFKQNSRLFENT